MMLVASFEASVRTDAERRIQLKSRDGVRKRLRDLFNAHPDRVRLVDILEIWDEQGALPEPPAARARLTEYVQAIRAEAPDFPRP
jgi:hypothetical protein